MLFARGIILVEGDAERFLLPAFAKQMDVALDHLGITVCSVAGTNFEPYAKFLTAMGLPLAIITDWDPRPAGHGRGYQRAATLVRTIERARSGAVPAELEERLDRPQEGDLRAVAAEFGIFLNGHTLEVDLFNDGDCRDGVIETLREYSFGATRQGWIDGWEADPDSLDADRLLALVETIGKGRFAQRLATRLEDAPPPAFISDAITFLSERV